MKTTVKKATGMGRKRATTMIDWDSLEAETGMVFESTALAKKADVGTRSVSKSRISSDGEPAEPIMRSKAFEIVKATGVDLSLIHI